MLRRVARVPIIRWIHRRQVGEGSGVVPVIVIVIVVSLAITAAAIAMVRRPGRNNQLSARHHAAVEIKPALGQRECKDHRHTMMLGFAAAVVVGAGVIGGVAVLRWVRPLAFLDSDTSAHTLAGAVSRNDAPSIRSYLADLETHDPRDPGLLVIAADQGSIEIINLLIEAGWHANTPAESSEQAVLWGGGLSFSPGDGRVYPLSAAVGRLRERPDVIQLLLDNDADACARSMFNPTLVRDGDESLMTPRELATRLGHQSVAEMLPIC